MNIDLSPLDPPVFEPGSVWLAGAGPGDPGLLTLWAAHGLAHADHVVHDALVDPRILALARPGAVIQAMGKRGGTDSIDQDAITRRLIELARGGARVLRLKGGDPLVFGRGPDEIRGLVQAGVPFRIVPGVTAGIGGLAYAGIPVTDGTHNSSVAFVTGHDAAGGVPAGVDWDALGRGAQVLVIYMASRRLAEIAARLLAAGRPAAEPAALVSKASCADQQVLTTTLAALTDTDAPTLPAPMVLVVGPVVDMRAVMDWWRP